MVKILSLQSDQREEKGDAEKNDVMRHIFKAITVNRWQQGMIRG